jgi:hypothetical protein
LTQVEIPETVTTIQFQAFRGCVLLVSLNLPNSLTSIGDRAFYFSVLTGIDIPDSVASIRDFAFESCQSLRRIRFLANAELAMGTAVCGECVNLTTVEIPNGITSIPIHTFFYCRTLTTINLPNSVVLIDQGAFYGCESLADLVLPKNLRKVGVRAFSHCRELKSINIPDSITRIGVHAFLGNVIVWLLLVFPKIPN